MRIKSIAAIAVIVLATSQIASAGLIRNQIFKPPTAALDVNGLPPSAKIIEVADDDGIALSGISVAGDASKPLLLVFHGNASSAKSVSIWLLPVIADGYEIIAAEYRGYSANPGKPSQKGLAADADAFLKLARAQAGNRKIIVIGHSLGGGVALDLSVRHTLDAVITIGAFTSIKAFTPKIARAFVSDPFDNEAAVKKLDEPLYIVHGTADNVVPADHGDKLYHIGANADKIGGAIVLKNAGHQPSPISVLKSIKIATNGDQGPADANIAFYPFSAGKGAKP